MNDGLENRFDQALALFDEGRVDEAIAAFEDCRAIEPGNPHVMLNLGHALGAAGKPDRAVECYRGLLDPENPAMACAACWSLADLKGYRFSMQELAFMQGLEHHPEPHPQRFLLMFALARAYEQAGDMENAFSALQEANDQVAAARQYPAEAWRNLANSLAAIRNVPAPAEPPPGPTPIFIVGMPRSGSTLVEQILAAHSGVEATSELPFIENLARSLDRQGGFANALPRLDPGHCQRGALAYLGQVEPLLHSRPEYFTDKWPNNFWYVGLIRALFPGAPVINVIRDPLDNALAVYKQYFSHGNEHSFGLDRAADYWNVYLDVMAHWESLFPGDILHLSYARLARRPEDTIRLLLRHCGLAFEEGVLRFHELERHVMTPSAQQVRQPIYKSALGSAGPYRPFIADLLPRFEALEQRVERLLAA